VLNSAFGGAFRAMENRHAVAPELTCQRNQSSLARYYQLLPPFLERWNTHCVESVECSTTEMGKMGERLV